MLYGALKPLLFSLDAERAHNLVCTGLKLAQGSPGVSSLLSCGFTYRDPSLEADLLGLRFPNPVGLAAGFDKNAELTGILPAFGFGFIECGTVTALAQPGNPKPRLFRFPEQGALVNRLGFNNRGAEWVAAHLKRHPRPAIPLGLNIGKSKVVELARAVEDYLVTLEKLHPFADYITVNVSSPNTPRLRELQKDLDPLLAALQAKNAELSKAAGRAPKPLFVKIAPDLASLEVENILECCIGRGVAGIIATNTTLSREGLPPGAPQEGGLSGRPLFDKSNAILRHLYRKAGKKIVLVGVGGIASAEDAYGKIRAGASLVQIYTGWIYGGPGLAARVNSGLVELLRRDGFKNIQEAVGTESS